MTIIKATYAQGKKVVSPFSIETRLHYGFIIPHHSGMKYLIKGHFPAFELNYNISTYGKHQWEQTYDYPEWGFSFFYADVANPEQLGIATGIYPFINFHLLKKVRFQLNYRIGSGIGLVSKPFDSVENFKNNAIGSNFNIIIGNLLLANWKPSDRITLSTGVGMTHFSNGTYKMPNLGINITTVNIGMAYLFRHLPELIQDTIPSLQKRIEYSFMVSTGVKENYPIGGDKYAVFSLSADAGKIISHKSKVGVGWDVFYNTSLKQRFEKDIIIDNINIMQQGFHLAFELRVSKLSLFFNKGIYVYSKFKGDGLFYHRIATRYAISKHLLASISLKTHFFRADVIEFGLGYKL